MERRVLAEPPKITVKNRACRKMHRVLVHVDPLERKKEISTVKTWPRRNSRSRTMYEEEEKKDNCRKRKRGEQTVSGGPITRNGKRGGNSFNDAIALGTMQLEVLKKMKNWCWWRTKDGQREDSGGEDEAGPARVPPRRRAKGEVDRLRRWQDRPTVRQWVDESGRNLLSYVERSHHNLIGGASWGPLGFTSTRNTRTRHLVYTEDSVGVLLVRTCVRVIYIRVRMYTCV